MMVGIKGSGFITIMYMYIHDVFKFSDYNMTTSHPEETSVLHLEMCWATLYAEPVPVHMAKM